MVVAEEELARDALLGARHRAADDRHAVAVVEDVRTGLRIPATGLVAEVHASVEEVFYGDVHGIFSSVSRFLPKEGTLDQVGLTGFWVLCPRRSAVASNGGKWVQTPLPARCKRENQPKGAPLELTDHPALRTVGASRCLGPTGYSSRCC